MLIKSYLVEIICNHFDKEGLTYKLSASKAACIWNCFVADGLYLQLGSFKGRDIVMSIQTNDMICMGSFCETAIKYSPEGKGFLEENKEFGYLHDDVLRHNSPDELYAHVKAALRKVAETNEENQKV